MRKIVLYIADSLDGYIAGKDDNISWLFTDQDYGYKEFYASIDTALMGRKTYDEMLKMEGGNFIPDKKVYVFSQKIDKAVYDNYEVIKTNMIEFTRSLLKEPGKDIWLVGGGEIIKVFLENKLIDEIVVSIHPILIGSGIPLFPSGDYWTNLEVTDCIKFDSGLVQIKYNVKK
ncbi:MAG TPA: dihydrofolate reductase family protein [Ignavibacteriales bacterium]|nr:dihydrofolate reductase family protein [Ignavibacteriales bacterium]